MQLQYIYDQWGIPIIYSIYDQWVSGQPKYNELEWLDIFPEAKTILSKETKKHISKLNQEKNNIFKELIVAKNILSRSSFNDRFWIQALIDRLTIYHERLETQIKNKQWIIRKLSGAKDKPDNIGPDDIFMAKAIRITDFINGRRTGGRVFCKCPFHDEKTASFVIYPNNRWHCFGSCGVGGDIIDFIIKKESLKFIEAVKYLLNK